MAPTTHQRPRLRTRKGTARKKRQFPRWLLLLVLPPLLIIGLAAVNIAILIRPSQMEARARIALTDMLDVDYSFRSVEFGLLSGLTVRGLVIKNPTGCRAPEAVAIDELNLTFRLLDLARGRVTIDGVRMLGPRIHLERIDGALNLGLLAQINDDQSQTPTLPQIEVEDLQLLLCPETIAPVGEALRVPRATLRLPDGDSGFEIAGTAAVPAVRSVRFSGKGTDLSSFEAHLEVRRVAIDNKLRARIPPTFLDYWDSIEPSGRADLTVDIEVADGVAKHWQAVLEVVDGRMFAVDYGVEIDALSGQVRVTPDRVETIGALSGVVGHGDARIEGYTEFSADGTVTGSDIVLELAEISLGPESEALLPPDLIALWRDLNPVGRVGLRAHVQGEMTPERIDSELILHGVDFGFADLPYRIENLRGSVHFDGNRLWVDHKEQVVGSIGSSSLGLWGSAPVPFEGNLDLHVELEEFPLNRNLEEALPPAVREIWTLYDPGGQVDARAWIHGSIDDPEIGLTVDLNNNSMRYALFPYRVEDVTGTVEYQHLPRGAEGHRDRVTFKSVRGRNDSSDVALTAGSIGWGGDVPGHLELIIHSGNLLIDEDVLDALPDGAEEVVRSFHLEGRVDTQVEIFTRHGLTGAEKENPVEVRTTVNVLPPLRFRYEPLPYPMTFSSGQAIHTLSTGDIQFRQLQTDPNVGPRLIVEGVYGTDHEDPRRQVLDLELVEIRAWKGGPGLAIDDKLLDALPPHLRNFFEGIGLRGFCSGKFHVKYHHIPGKTGAERQEQVRYFGELAGHNLSVDFGVKFDEIDARLQFGGSAVPGRPHSFQGTANINQLRFNRFRVHSTEVKFCYGLVHPAIQDALAGKFKPPEGGQFEISPLLQGRLGHGNIDQTLQVYVRQGNLYRGNVEGFLYFDSGSQGDFHADLRADRIDLSKGGKDIFRDDGAEGFGNGWVRFEGLGNDPGSITGEGQMRVRRAKLKELPLFVATLGTLLSLNVRATEGRHIEKITAKFKIRDEAFHIDDYSDLEIVSPALTVLSKGKLDFAQQLDLFLSPQLFGWILPLKALFSPIFIIHVTGSLDDPQQRVVPFVDVLGGRNQ